MIEKCEKDGRSGFRYGETGECYTYQRGDGPGQRAAENKALADQNRAINEEHASRDHPQKITELEATIETAKKEINKEQLAEAQRRINRSNREVSND